MSIFYAAVVRPETEGRKVLLFEYMDDRRPNVKTGVFRDVLPQVGATSSIPCTLYQENRYKAAVAVRVRLEVTLIFVVAAKRAMRDDRLRDMLLKMQAQVSARPDLPYKTATQDDLRIHLEPGLHLLVEKVNVEQAGDMGAYSDEGEPTVAQTSVEKEQSGVEKPPKILKNDSGKMLDHGETLSDTLAPAEKLDDSAVSSRTNAGYLQHQTLWNLYKWQFFWGGFASMLGGLFYYRFIRK